MPSICSRFILLISAVFVLLAFGTTFGAGSGIPFPSNNNKNDNNGPQLGNHFLHMIGSDAHDGGNATNSSANSIAGDKQQEQEQQVLVKKAIRRRHVHQQPTENTRTIDGVVRKVNIRRNAQTNNNPSIAGVFNNIGTCQECCETYCVPMLFFPGGPKDGFSQGMHFCAQVRPGAIVSNTPYLLFFEFLAWAGFIAFCALALASGIGCCCGCYYCCSKAWECI